MKQADRQSCVGRFQHLEKDGELSLRTAPSHIADTAMRTVPSIENERDQNSYSVPGECWVSGRVPLVGRGQCSHCRFHILPIVVTQATEGVNYRLSDLLQPRPFAQRILRRR